jgi:DNA-binding GntR family transcriptional regulator
MDNGITTANLSCYDRLKALILSGKLATGSWLSERSVAAELGVSRTPVREAILRLSREGLVQVAGNRGAYVASYSIEDVIQIYHVRIGLEPLAARLGCATIPKSELDAFEHSFERFRDSAELRMEQSDVLGQLGRDFHALFIRASGSTRLIQILDDMRDQINLVRGWARAIDPDSGYRVAIEEHLEILRALRSGDADLVEKSVRSHLDNGLKYRLAHHGIK